MMKYNGLAIISLTLCVVFGFIGFVVDTKKSAKIEGCKTTMRDMYEDAGLKAVDEKSLAKFCTEKFSK